jgi:hypothetical protein
MTNSMTINIYPFNLATAREHSFRQHVHMTMNERREEKDEERRKEIDRGVEER